MKAFLALIVREYREHRGAFLYAPLLLLGVFALALAGMTLTGRSRFSGIPGADLNKVFEIGFALAAGLWWLYLLAALFFFFADAFSSDRRNNSILFWKSMPQSDLVVIGSKFAAGLSVFPLVIFGIALASGVLVLVALLVAGANLSFAAPLALVPALWSFIQITLAALAFFVLGLLWYAPFFAYVGALSSLVGRWSIPLALLLPALLVLFENLLFFRFGDRGGYVAQLIARRADYGLEGSDVGALAGNPDAFSALDFIGDLVASIDWLAMGGGLIFAFAMIALSAEVRRNRLT